MYQNVNAFYQSLTYAVVASQIASLCETDCFSVLRHARHWEKTTTICPKLAFFNCTYPFTWPRLKFLIYANGGNHENTPIIVTLIPDPISSLSDFISLAHYGLPVVTYFFRMTGVAKSVLVAAHQMRSLGDATIILLYLIILLMLPYPGHRPLLCQCRISCFLFVSKYHLNQQDMRCGGRWFLSWNLIPQLPQTGCSWSPMVSTSCMVGMKCFLETDQIEANKIWPMVDQWFSKHIVS